MKKFLTILLLSLGFCLPAKAQISSRVTATSIKNAMSCADTSVSANTITCSTFQGLTGYSTGETFFVQVANTTTGATTININSLGAKNVTKNGTTAIASGDLVANGNYAMRYDGTEFVVLGSIGAGSLPPSPTSPNTTFGITSTPSNGVAGTTQWLAASQGINSQTGTTYTIQSNPIGTTTSDLGQIITANNAAAQTYTMCNIGTDTGCVVGFFVAIHNIGAGTVTVVAHAGQTITGDTIVPPGNFALLVVDSSTDTRLRTVVDLAAIPNCTDTGGNHINFTTSTGLFSCGTTGSGGGVTSFTGDGTILSNSASTGAVTATLVNALADSVLGNPTGAAAAPVYTTNPVVGTITAGSLKCVSSGCFATSPGINETYQGGNDVGNISTEGGGTYRGGDVVGGTSASVAGPTMLRGGNDSSASATSSAGPVEVLAGAATGTTQGQQGIANVVGSFVKGATVTQWNLETVSAAKTVTDAAASPGYFACIAEVVGTNQVQCVLYGETAVNVSNTAVVGDTVCTGTTAGKGTDSGGTTACANGTGIGIVEAISGTWKFSDGTSFTASASLPLVIISKD